MLERFASGIPTIFDNLQDGSIARGEMIVRFKQAEFSGRVIEVFQAPADIQTEIIDIQAVSRERKVVGGPALVVGTVVIAALAAACGGGSAEGKGDTGSGKSAQNVHVTPVATATPIETQRTVVIPTPTATPDNRANTQSQNFMERVVTLKINQEANKEIQGHLTRAAVSESQRDKFNAYSSAFSQLRGQYYATADSQTLAVLKDLKDYLQKTFPDRYDQAVQINRQANLHDPFEIVERN